MKLCHVVELGSIGYGQRLWALQERLVAARKRGAAPDVLLLCEHPHVVTLGRSGKLDNLRASDELCARWASHFIAPTAAATSPIMGLGNWSAIRSCSSARFAAMWSGTCACWKRP